jgi:hypothetical protein
MLDILKLFEAASIPLIVAVLVAYLARNYIESAMKSRFANFETLVKSSIAIKESLRSQEHKELVDFRVAVERWEYFLQTGIADLTMQSESTTFEPADFHKTDQELFGAVRVAAVKASIYLRDPQLEVELLKTISAIRQMYYPLLAGTMQSVLELQGQMIPLLSRMRQFEAGGQRDVAIALNPDEGRILVGLRHKMSDELRGYAEKLVAQYRPIAEQLYELKQKISVHIYRPVQSAAVNDA